MFRNKRLLLILVLVVVLIALIAAAVALGLRRSRAARSLTVYRVEGDCAIERAGEGALQAAENTPLRSGDLLRTGADGGLYARFDGNKYVYAAPDTRCALEAGGSARENDTLLKLENGTLMIHVMSALGVKSSFAVETADARFSVRGTSFRVDAAEDGSELYVFDGKVEVAPQSGGETQTFTRGQHVRLRGGAIAAVEDEIDYASMSLEALSFLNVAAEKGKILSISTAQLQETIAHNGGMLLVKFLVGGDVFGTQTVAYGEHAHAPKLLPAPEGEWRFDFSTPITKDTEIVWAA